MLYRHAERGISLPLPLAGEFGRVLGNRCVQHHAMWDYYPQSRHGHRVTIKATARFIGLTPTSPHAGEGAPLAQPSPSHRFAMALPLPHCGRGLYPAAFPTPSMTSSNRRLRGRGVDHDVLDADCLVGGDAFTQFADILAGPMGGHEIVNSARPILAKPMTGAAQPASLAAVQPSPTLTCGVRASERLRATSGSG